VSGGTQAAQRLFSSQLYHSLLMPNTYSDVSGRYTGMDGRVHSSTGTEYANYSGWDVYRSQFPLIAMLAPHAASDMARSLLDEGAQSSGQLPKWPLLGTQNDVMVGDPADLMLAGAWALGARGFSARGALAAMVHGASVPGQSRNDTYVERAGLADYLRLGYVPAQDDVNVATQTYVHTAAWGAVSTTLEYALADFAIARMAHGLHAPAICRAFAARGGNWRHVFDPSSGYVRLRSRDGSWTSPFAPLSETGFAEGDAAQYTWAVPQDVSGLVGALGGRAAARARLDRFFTRLNGGGTSPYAFLGNEPTLDTPYLYDWLGAPSAGAAVIRRALLGLYTPGAAGEPGNDDGGEMSSWWVLSALGLYPAVPGTDVLALTAPLFPQATLRLPGGTLRLRAPGATAATAAIRSVRLGGRALTRTWLDFSALRRGGTLRFALARRGGTWGQAAPAAPPSYAPAATCRS
jgi:predicted alpha-1,2-mannosidase